MANTVFEMQDDTLIAKPVGELDTETSPAFEEELLKKMAGVKHIVIDLEQVDYVSSAGLRVFLVAQQRVQKEDADLKLIHVNGNIMEVLEIVGFLDVVTVE